MPPTVKHKQHQLFATFDERQFEVLVTETDDPVDFEVSILGDFATGFDEDFSWRGTEGRPGGIEHAFAEAVRIIVLRCRSDAREGRS